MNKHHCELGSLFTIEQTLCDVHIHYSSVLIWSPIISICFYVASVAVKFCTDAAEGNTSKGCQQSYSKEAEKRYVVKRYIRTVCEYFMHAEGFLPVERYEGNVWSSV